MNNALKLTIPALMLSLLTACASTSTVSYEPEESGDYQFDPNSSFAMNVVEGSLGFHNGLRDADAPKDADTNPTAINYVGDAYLGLMANGIGGALLGFMGTNYGQAPLDHSYGIVYVAVQNHSKEMIDFAFNQADTFIAQAIAKESGDSYLHTAKVNGHPFLIFAGDKCLSQRKASWASSVYYSSSINDAQIAAENQCWLGSYSKLTLMRFSTVDPSGHKGNYAVIGIPQLGMDNSLAAVRYLPDNFYVYQPKSPKNGAPFVLNNKRAWFFIKPSVEAKLNKSQNFTSEVTYEQVKEYFPKIF